MQRKFSNHLAGETSPYLLQHAHNPVNWFPWNDHALQLARDQNKPILVSIGYSACHWCHVMERESFEDEATASFMNEHFINIKIDREERPDLDHIYMDAVQAMTGSGGWPLNVFLTPEAKPFYGGTYFPPKPAFNRPSWMQVLTSIIQSYSEKRHEIDAQAENLTDHLIRSTSFSGIKASEVRSWEQVEDMITNLMKQADNNWGGFGKAPKFPQSFSIRLLLRWAHVSKINSNDNMDESLAGKGLQQALLSLDKMIEGGIYDQIGGGFARYSTDEMWLAPHFEKMLYDNALLVDVLAEAYQLTGNERYREVIDECIEFVKRELMSPGFGFYAALDADSEGVEGKYYVWEKKETTALLGADAPLVEAYFNVTEKGNWEHTSILRLLKKKEDFAAENNLTVDELNEVLQRSKKILFDARDNRERPLLDDKIILGWNALMNAASSKAFAATGNENYLQLAVDNMHFLIDKFRNKTTNQFHHTWKNNEAKFPAFLDDLSFLVHALIMLQEVTSDVKWLDEAIVITNEVVNHFSEEDSHFFYYTRDDQHDVIIRKREVYDSAVPSGNSMMAYNLHRLGILADRLDWRQRADDMIAELIPAVTRYPGSFGNWATLLLEMQQGTYEIAITGKSYRKELLSLMRLYMPHKVIMAAEKEDSRYSLLANRETEGNTAIWLCRNYTCQAPVFSVPDLITLINRGGNGQLILS